MAFKPLLNVIRAPDFIYYPPLIIVKNFEPANLRLKTNKNRGFDPAFVGLLPIRDAFRTIDWRKIKEELETFKFAMGDTINSFVKI